MDKTTGKDNEQTIEYYKVRNEELEAKIKWYEEQFRLLQKQKYGASSEKTNEDQLSLPLFNEAEDTADTDIVEPEIDTITYERKKTRKTRKDLMEDLPVETIEYKLSPEEQVCLCCGNDTHKNEYGDSPGTYSDSGRSKGSRTCPRCAWMSSL